MFLIFFTGNDNPMGFVSLVQSSSTLGHRRKKGSVNPKLPTSDEEKCELNMEDTMTHYNERRLEEFGTHFDDSSWLFSISSGWKGGVHVQVNILFKQERLSFVFSL